MARIVGEIKVNQLAINRNPDDPKIATYTIVGKLIKDVFYNETKPELMTYQDQLKVTEVTFGGTILAVYYIDVTDVGDFIINDNVITRLVITGERLQTTGDREPALLTITPSDIIKFGSVLAVRFPYYGKDSKQFTEISNKYSTIRFDDMIYYRHVHYGMTVALSENCELSHANIGIIALYSTSKIPSIRDLRNVADCGAGQLRAYAEVANMLIKNLEKEEK